MARTESNPPIRIKGKGFILGYDHITSYTNSKQKFLKVNRKLALKLAAEGGRKEETEGGTESQLSLRWTFSWVW